MPLDFLQLRTMTLIAKPLLISKIKTPRKGTTTQTRIYLLQKKKKFYILNGHILLRIGSPKLWTIR